MLSAREANRRYFQEAYLTGRHGWAAEQPSHYAVDYLNELTKLVPGGSLLDVGCGEGRHSIAAAELGFRVTGIDYEPLALERARDLAAVKRVGQVEFLHADVFSLPFPDAEFDVVLDYGCLHHQRKSDWPRYRVEILRVLKPGGYFVLSVFSPRFRLFHTGKRRWHIARGSYRRCFTSADITALFGRDFEMIELTEQRGKGGGFWHALGRRRTLT